MSKNLVPWTQFRKSKDGRFSACPEGKVWILKDREVVVGSFLNYAAAKKAADAIIVSEAVTPETDVSQQTALEVARRLWGSRAVVRYDAQAPDAEAKKNIKRGSPLFLSYRCSFGHVTDFGGFFHVEGQGDSWIEALERYDLRQDSYRKKKLFNSRGKRKKGIAPIWKRNTT